MLGEATEDWLNTTSFKLILGKLCNFKDLGGLQRTKAGNMNTEPSEISSDNTVGHHGKSPTSRIWIMTTRITKKCNRKKYQSIPIKHNFLSFYVDVTHQEELCLPRWRHDIEISMKKKI